MDADDFFMAAILYNSKQGESKEDLICYKIREQAIQALGH